MVDCIDVLERPVVKVYNFSTVSLSFSLQALLHVHSFVRWLEHDSFHLKNCPASRDCCTCAVSRCFKAMSFVDVHIPAKLCSLLQGT